MIHISLFVLLAPKLHYQNSLCDKKCVATAQKLLNHTTSKITMTGPANHHEKRSYKEFYVSKG